MWQGSGEREGEGEGEGGRGRVGEGGKGRAHLMYSNRALSTAVKNSLTPIPASADTPTVCMEHTQHAWRSVVAYTAHHESLLSHLKLEP